MDVPDFRTVTVEALAAMVRDRSLTAAAVTAHALERIEALNSVLNAFVAVDADGARAQAAAIDERLDAGDEAGPLAGIPIGVKDLADAAGFCTSKGAMYTRNDPPAASDCIEVARMRAAGCVVVGKTNTPEHGCMGDTYNPRFGATLNPWNPERSPGGSSGGTGAAVASGMVPVGTGSDGGGSIRIPSALCGLSGIKTSHGRVPSGPPPSGLIDLSCVGPMARLIRDVALCLDSLVGPDPADLRSLPKPEASWRAALDSPRLPDRVLWAPSLDGGPVDSEIATACEAAVQRLAAEGVEVDEAHTEITAVPGSFLQLFFGGLIGPALRPLYGTDEWDNVTDVLITMLEDVYESGRATSESIYEARRQAGELSIALAELMDGYDALLLPTLAGQAPAPGGHGTINGVETPNWFRFTPLANLTRRPAATVCCGFSREGVPIGLQAVGHQLEDLAVLETIAVLEDLLALDPIAPITAEARMPLISAEFLRHARAELASGDRLQAGEKAWGAVAHCINAISKRKGWKLGSHRQLIDNAQRLIGSEGEEAERLRLLLGYVQSLHKNFYEELLRAEEVAEGIAHAEELVAALERLADT